MDFSKVRHALVTGGASGIGLGIVDAFAERGVAVTVIDIFRERLDEQFAHRLDRILPYQLDTRDRAGWVEAKRAAEARFGAVDVLVNNAGIGPDGHELADMDVAAFDRTIEIDLTAVFNGVRAFVGDMRARRSGHIVNTGSMNGLLLGMARFGAYATAKFGVSALSEALRAELEPYDVGVSVLCPGPVLSNMTQTLRLLAGDAPPRLWPEGTVGMQPITAGRIVVRGVELNLSHILTHPELWPAVDHRNEVIREAVRIAAAEWPAISGSDYAPA